MALRITVTADYPIDPIEIEITDMLRVFSLGVHMKPRSVVEAMQAKRNIWPGDDFEFGQACKWVLHGSTHDIYADTDVLGFVTRRCIEVLGITHEQELEINQLLRDMVAYDNVCALEPFPLPEAAE